MQENKTIKISLSTFFLILAIIAICIISYFLFKSYNEKVKLENEVVSLKEQNENSADKIIKESLNVNSIKENVTGSTVEDNVKIYSYKDIKGLYNFTKEIENDIEAYYNLYLYENGTFKYEYGTMSPNSIIGNYTIVDNTIALNKIFIGGGDVGLRTTKGEIKLEINDDGTITDKNNLINGLDVNLSNIKLNKASTQKEQEYIKYSPSIMEHINSSLNNNAVTVE